MKPYLLSLGAGLLVGVIYALLSVRSPAPPAIALIGLMGILLGEQAVPIIKRLAAGAPVMAFIRSGVRVRGNRDGRRRQALMPCVRPVTAASGSRGAPPPPSAWRGPRSPPRC
ncbi:XapX domain-containing protein [Caulobacter sp. 602-2]|uniref:XapX domain-containing protein n=1 Tax=Caulobacter sp. 602-2 TaxID=2710887 RepID=A0A6G4QZZ1_9CAUL|nr:DUF1427 family protein [Caulobacter sp. 602-2]NGM50894.1 XapX domain-containing protein [Caulobacter sp. 602-2]